MTNRMKSIRKEQRLSSKFVANLLKMSESKYLILENTNYNQIPAAMQAKIQKLYGVSKSDLNTEPLSKVNQAIKNMQQGKFTKF